MQILILGMHRSGTSLTTRLVNMMGAWFGPEMGAGEINNDNPKGFWEHPEVFKLNEAILAAKGCSWHNLSNWRFEDADKAPGKLAGHIQGIIRRMDAQRPWVLKDPRNCLLLPAWRPYLDAPVSVIVQRDPVEIAVSLQKRDRFPLEYGIALWEYYAVGMMNATRDMPRVFVQHSQLLREPVAASKALYGQLARQVPGLSMPGEGDIRNFIDPALYRSKVMDAADMLSPQQRMVNDIIQGLRPAPDSLSVSEPSLDIMKKGLAA